MIRLMKKSIWPLAVLLLVMSFLPAFAAGNEVAFPSNEKWERNGGTPLIQLWGGPVNQMPHWYTQIVSKAEMNSEVLDYYKKWRDDFYKVYTTVDGKNVGVIEGPITGTLSGEEGIWKNAECISASEHTGYGMIIFALMAGYPGDNGETKAKFDSLVRLYLGLKRDNNLMSWAVPKNTDIFKNALTTANKKNLPFSATDGDFDIAYALLLADKQWPNDMTHGATYKTLALNMINKGIYNDLIFHDTKRITLGDWHSFGIADGWADGTNQADLLVFNKYVTRSSDFMIDNLRAFAEVADAGKQSLFNDAIDECFRIFDAFNGSYNKNANGVSTGLISDFIINDYEIVENNGKYTITFGSAIKPAPEEVYAALEEDFPINAYTENSCRVPERLALDYIHSGNARTKQQLALLKDFITPLIGGAFGPIWDKVRDGYALNGSTMDWGPNHLGTHSGVDALQFMSCLVSSSVISTSVNLGEGFYSISSRHASDGCATGDAYFKDTLGLMNMLIISGNWWYPQHDFDDSVPPVEGWQLGTSYVEGDRVYYDGQIWDCVYDHTAESPEWYPGAPGLWFWRQVN